MAPSNSPRDDYSSPRGPSSFRVDPSDRAYRRSGPPETPPRSSSLSGLIRPLAAILVAAICAGGLWVAYKHFSHGEPSGGIPFISADKGVVKKKPDPNDAGGQAIADDGDDVYNIGQTDPKAERLMPAPEQPLPKPVPVPDAPEPVAPPVATQAGPTGIPVPPPGPVAASPSQTDAAQSSDLAKLMELSLKDQAPAKNQPAKDQASTSTPAGPLRVQIAATKDDATARQEWLRLQKAHADLLGDLSATIVKADLGDRGVFYRVQAGPVADHAAADRLCTALKALSIGCMIAKPQ